MVCTENGDALAVNCMDQQLCNMLIRRCQCSKLCRYRSFQCRITYIDGIDFYLVE